MPAQATRSELSRLPGVDRPLHYVHAAPEGIILPTMPARRSSRRFSLRRLTPLPLSIAVVLAAKPAYSQHAFSLLAPAQEVSDSSGIGAARAEVEEEELPRARRGEVSYTAGSIEYSVPEDVIILREGARVSYEQLRVEADTVEYNIGSHVIVARGSPVLWDGTQEMTGAVMAYDMESEKGVVGTGRTQVEKGWFTGRLIRKVDEDALNVHGGTFTTCDETPPHYWFAADRMKIYRDDMVICRPLVLMVQDVPIMALPFWFFPIRRDRHSGFLMPRFGEDEREGRYIKNLAYYYVVNDYADATLTLDYMENLGYHWLLEGLYVARPRLSGQFIGTYIEDRQSQTRRWSARFAHLHRVAEGLNVQARGSFVSDSRFYTDISGNLEERLRRDTQSYLSISKSWSSARASVVFEEQRNLDTDQRNAKLPDASLVLVSRPLLPAATGRQRRGSRGEENLRWYSRLYVSGKSRLIRSESTTGGDHQAIDSRAELSYSPQLFGWLNLSPRLTYYETWYDRDIEDRRNVRRGIYQVSGGLSTTAYGYFRRRLGPIRSMRHVVRPRLTYRYTPEQDQSKLYRFAGIGTIGAQDVISGTIGNTFQAKIGEGESERSLDLAYLDVSASYNRRREERRLSDITSRLDVRPTSALRIDLSTTHDPYDRRLERLDLTLSLVLAGRRERAGPEEEPEGELPGAIGEEREDELTPPALVDGGGSAPRTASAETPSPAKRPWRLSLSHTYSRRAMGEQEVTEARQVWGSLGVNLTKHWRVDYSMRYDLDEREVVSQRLQVYRDLHCWEAGFNWSLVGDRWSYDFRVGVRAIPEIKIEPSFLGFVLP